MTKSPSNEMSIRHERAAELLEDPEHPLRTRAKVVELLAKEYKVSLQQARTYATEGERLISRSFDLEGVRHRHDKIQKFLEVIAEKALKENNINAAVGATKAMVNHFKRVVEIDQPSAWDRSMTKEYYESAKEPNPNKKIPKHRIGNLDSMDGDNYLIDDIPF